MADGHDVCSARSKAQRRDRRSFPLVGSMAASTASTTYEIDKGKTAAATPLPPQLATSTTVSSRPAISALFLVEFDVKKGYNIAWKRTIKGLDLDDSVEFKSLPSGLHNVEEDLVYFVHENHDNVIGQPAMRRGTSYAGISAFVNKTAAKHERGALMLAVGALIKLDNGRLGRSWRHANRLKELAAALVADEGNTELLESYWKDNRAENVRENTIESQAGEVNEDGSGSKDTFEDIGHETQDSRPSLEQAQAKSLMPSSSQGLSMFHPARSLPSMLESFGPLIYPLYRAALLRKRILLLTDAPVELACNFVYNISIISNLPSALESLIPLEPLPVRLSPLFSVGVHDIDYLLQSDRRSESQNKNGDDSDTETPDTQSSEGWVACTTDDVLRHKKNLFDVVVTLPEKPNVDNCKHWPQIQLSDDKALCANQRDVRRYRQLWRNVTKKSNASDFPQAYRDDDSGGSSSEEDSPLLKHHSRIGTKQDEEPIPDLPASSLEPTAWSALAYSSFIWWASAGEKGAELEEEAANDSALFNAYDGRSGFTDSLPSGKPASLRSSHTGAILTDGTPSAPEMAIIAYFHRLSTGIVEVLANLVDDSEEDEEAEARQRNSRRNRRAEGQSQGEAIMLEKKAPKVVIDAEDMVRMGLDPWSEGDRSFVTQMLELYWGRKADIKGGRVECCGLRVC